MPDKPDPTKRQPWHPPGEPSPTIYPPGGGDPATRRPYDFPLIKISGKPLSQTVIEDRGPEMPDPTKRKAKYPPGEFSPTIYPEEVDEETMRRAFDFEPETIRGKPLSETVTEDREAGR